MHALNPSGPEAEAGGFCEFEATLVYIVRTRTARGTHGEKKTNKQAKPKQSPDSFNPLQVVPTGASICSPTIGSSRESLMFG